MKKSALLKFFDLKRVEFRAIFGAAKVARLSPATGNKSKSAEIMPF